MEVKINYPKGEQAVVNMLVDTNQDICVKGDVEGAPSMVSLAISGAIAQLAIRDNLNIELILRVVDMQTRDILAKLKEQR